MNPNPKTSSSCFSAPRLVTLAALCLFLGGCSVGPDYSTPSAPVPAAYKNVPSDWQKAQPMDAQLRGKWWEIYHDPQLNALEEQVNISNQNILQAEAQFRQAAAEVKVARAAYYPTVSSSPSFTESQAAILQEGGSGGGKGGKSSGSVAESLFDVPAQASYVVDIWGSVRRNVEATSATAEASFATLENDRLSYEGTLAEDYFNLRGLDAEEKLLQDTVKAYEENVKLTTNRYKSGIASQGDVAQAQTQLATTRAQLIDIGVQRAEYEDAIATLAGKPAPAFSLGKKVLKVTPPKTPAGIPSYLLQRRPDIAAAERQMASANASIGVQVAGYYPQLSLSGSTGTEAIQIGELFSGPSFFWSVGATLAQTLFNGGQTHGLVQEAQANYDATVANYRETVLTAFQQVEDDLSGLRILEAESTAEDEAVKSAQQSLDVVTNEYKAGTEDYLSVITAETTLLGDQVSQVSVRTRRMTTSVLLVEALGGGWDVSQMPATANVAGVPQAQAQIDKGNK